MHGPVPRQTRRIVSSNLFNHPTILTSSTTSHKAKVVNHSPNTNLRSRIIFSSIDITGLNMASDDSHAFQPTTHTGGTVYHYHPDLTAYEHAPSTSSGSGTPSANAISTVVFINGMHGYPLSTTYTQKLSSTLPAQWRLVEPLLNSAGTGFGTYTLTQDVDEVSLLVRYLRGLRPQGRIVLLGHSTGCQDAIHYLCAPGRDKRFSTAAVEGVILQAPVSDREATSQRASEESLKPSIDLAHKYIQEGRAQDILPSAMTRAVYPRVPVSAYRWLSLMSPAPAHDGEDDYFSSDLGRERWESTFGGGGKGMKWLVLHGSEDDGVPAHVDKEALLAEWKEATEEGGGIWDKGSGVLPGADHPLKECDEAVREDFVKRVLAFLERV